jgi:hypothetical protein
MKPIAYEVEPGIEIRRQLAKTGQLSDGQPDRWYIYRNITQCGYIGRDGNLVKFDPIFFESAEAALDFWNEIKGCKPRPTGAELLVKSMLNGAGVLS